MDRFISNTSNTQSDDMDKVRRIKESAFRYVRVLREELLEYSFCYVSDKGWIPPLSKLENCLRVLAAGDPKWNPAHALVVAIYDGKPKNWDDIRKSKDLDVLIDWLRDERRDAGAFQR